MNRQITFALLALNIAVCFSAPQNSVAVEKKEQDSAVSYIYKFNNRLFKIYIT